MAAPRELPLEARRAAWGALWRILLAPRPDGDRGPSASLDTPGVERGKKGAPDDACATCTQQRSRPPRRLG